MKYTAYTDVQIMDVLISTQMVENIVLQTTIKYSCYECVQLINVQVDRNALFIN